jgi:hypothetical protein
MLLTLHTRKDLGHVIQTPDQTWAKVKTPGRKLLWAPPTIPLTVQTFPEKRVYRFSKRGAPASLLLLQTGGDIGIQRQRCSHGLMLET